MHGLGLKTEFWFRSEKFQDWIEVELCLRSESHFCKLSVKSYTLHLVQPRSEPLKRSGKNMRCPQNTVKPSWPHNTPVLHFYLDPLGLCFFLQTFSSTAGWGSEREFSKHLCSAPWSPPWITRSRGKLGKELSGAAPTLLLLPYPAHASQKPTIQSLLPASSLRRKSAPCTQKQK